jgi:hypothetical protein
MIASALARLLLRSSVSVRFRVSGGGGFVITIKIVGIVITIKIVLSHNLQMEGSPVHALLLLPLR